MTHWTEDLHLLLLQISGAMNRPELDDRFLARAGVKLDRALFPLLTRIGAAAPIGAVELAGLVGRDHSTVSRQTAKLEELGLVEREVSSTDRRVRMLRPTEAGRKMLAEFNQTRRRILEDRLRGWSDEDRRALLTLLRQMGTDLLE